jgi:FkbM family methyltransferase
MIAAAANIIQQVGTVLTKSELAECLSQLETRKEYQASDVMPFFCDAAHIGLEDVERARLQLAKNRNDFMASLTRTRQDIETLTGDAELARLVIQSVMATLKQNGGRAPGKPPRPAGDDRMRVRLNLRQTEYLVDIPRAPDALFNIFQMFVEQHYKHSPLLPCSRIFDLGAFIGLGSVYVSNLYPAAEVVAVEPSPLHLTYLRANMANNSKIRSRIIPAAIGASRGKMKMRIPTTLSMGVSSVGHLAYGDQCMEEVDVDVVPVADLDQTEAYGIKIDVEGAEFQLADSKSFFENAQWVMGEMHFGRWTRPEDSWFRSLLNKHFDLAVLATTVHFQDAGFWISQDFQAMRKAATGGGSNGS